MKAAAPRPFASAGARGRAYAPLPAELEAALPLWLAGRVPEGEAIKPGRVWRVGPWLVKRSGRGGLKDLFRRGPALRAAERARALDAIPTPQPLVALERRRGRALESGLVVSEWIAGRHLHELWDDARALAAFPPFLARMHAAGVLHGDFHPRNALWDGERWVLLDLEGVRGPLHRLFARRLVRRQWARLLHNLEHARPDCRPDVRALFERYLEEVGRAGDRERAWAAVVREAARLP